MKALLHIDSLSEERREVAPPNVMLTGTQGAALGVQRAKRAGLSSLLGRSAKPDSRSTERTTRKEYHLRLPVRDATARTNTDLL
jgi:hypothetical protein